MYRRTFFIVAIGGIGTALNACKIGVPVTLTDPVTRAGDQFNNGFTDLDNGRNAYDEADNGVSSGATTRMAGEGGNLKITCPDGNRFDVPGNWMPDNSVTQATEGARDLASLCNR